MSPSYRCAASLFICGLLSSALSSSTGYAAEEVPKAASAPTAAPQDLGAVAAKPLFRDPIYDGAADPVVVWNRKEKKWFMFYTNRRAKLATMDPKDLIWFHGTRIGIAESSNGGASWRYRGVAKINYGKEDFTHWAPEIVEHEGVYHMFLTIVPGTVTSWNHPRDIIHLTSSDLLDWKYETTLKLASDRVIDPCVLRLPKGTWRLWYNNEKDRKSIYYAESTNLNDWEDRGKVAGVGERPGEGPKVFRWKDRYWMIVDLWKGFGVYHSDDATNWTAQKTNLLSAPGSGLDDADYGRHADVVVDGDRAWVFYFTHPGRTNPEAKDNPTERARSSLQVVELHYTDGQLTCDRNAPTRIRLQPPSE
jgi:hypothetical protein